MSARPSPRIMSPRNRKGCNNLIRKAENHLSPFYQNADGIKTGMLNPRILKPYFTN